MPPTDTPLVAAADHACADTTTVVAVFGDEPTPHPGLAAGLVQCDTCGELRWTTTIEIDRTEVYAQ